MIKIHYVYKIMNLENGKFYIGKHSSDSIEDEYYGSGALVKMAIKKYGIENFSKSIIAVFETSDEAYELEAQLVTLEQVKDKMCYNMVVGGYGAGAGTRNHFYGKKHAPATKIKMSESTKHHGSGNPFYGKKHSNESKLKIGAYSSQRIHTGETKRKMATIQMKDVCQYDKKTGQFIAEFDSVKSATKSLGKNYRIESGIYKAAGGVQKSAYGYIWKYKT